jgi:fatty acid-binding protein DegV
VHADAGPAVDAAIDRLHARGFEPAVHLIGPVVGTHLGPGAIGVAFLGAPDPA